jgi:predicted AlkP superfamily phosphohydrolase/phosphomutase/tetratricopeptide (TPR) repeat protein
MPALAKKVLLIGWDAADWKHINPLLDQGLLPTLEQFITDGVMGNLATLQPILSPMLWNSIATGKRPYKHGILGFTEPDPQGRGIRPSSSTSRKVKAIWNILTQRGYKSHVVSWFAGHPAEPINGVCISPHVVHPSAELGRPWPLPPRSVHPEELRDTIAGLRIHPGELGAEEILPFIPKAADIDQEKDKRLSGLMKVMAENCTVHNAATWILQNQEWDFLGVYYDGIDHFCHAFMQFHAPRMEGLDEKQFEIYKEVINGAYRFHDMMLYTLLQMAGEDVTVIICSDHGFHSDHLRPRGVPDEPAGPAVWHRPLGMVAMKGPHIKKDERIYGASLPDITPTVLTLFGLPVGEDMDGKPLVTAFEEPPEIEHIPSWEDVPGECGRHAADDQTDPIEAKAALDQMVALGYIDQPDEDKSKAMDMAVREMNYNLARAYVDGGKPADALPLLEELNRAHPEERRFANHLAGCYLSLRRIPEARKIVESFLDGKEPKPWANLLLGIMSFEEGDVDTALVHLQKAEQAEPRIPNLHLRLGSAYLRKGRVEDARRAFQKAVEIDEDSAQAHLGLAMVALRARQHEEAAKEALTAVGLQHYLPAGHYRLGVALVRLGHLERARVAFETTLSLAPGMILAHRWLAVLYRLDGQLDKFAEHRTRAAELRLARRTRRNLGADRAGNPDPDHLS